MPPVLRRRFPKGDRHFFERRSKRVLVRFRYKFLIIVAGGDKARVFSNVPEALINGAEGIEHRPQLVPSCVTYFVVHELPAGDPLGSLYNKRDPAGDALDDPES